MSFDCVPDFSLKANGLGVFSYLAPGIWELNGGRRGYSPVTQPEFPSGHFFLACDYGEPGNHSTNWEGKDTGPQEGNRFS